MLDNPLCIQFSNSTVFIRCDDDLLRQTLSQHFRHALGQAGTATVTYQITTIRDNRMQLKRDDILLYAGDTLAYLIEVLMQDIGAMLTTHSRKHLVFHAAGLTYKSQGLILCAESGRGKSTLTTWLVATGFDYLSDELVAVSLDVQEMKGFTRPIVLKLGSTFVWKHWLTEKQYKNIAHFPDGTIWLPPELLRSGCIQPVAQPKILIFPHYQPSHPVLDRQLTSAETAFQLMQHLINAKNLPEMGLRATMNLAQQCIAYKLTYDDLTKATTWIEQTMTKPFM